MRPTGDELELSHGDSRPGFPADARDPMIKCRATTSWLRPTFSKLKISSCSVQNNTEKIDIDSKPIEQEISGIACRLNSCQGRRWQKRKSQWSSASISIWTKESVQSHWNRITDLAKPQSFGLRYQHREANLTIRCFHHWNDRRSHWYSPMINSDKPISTSNNQQHTWTAGQDVEVFFNSYWCGMMK